jgi:hypothetical protein
MERRSFHVLFSFGSFAIVGVTIKEGESINDAIKRRSADIEQYLLDGKWHKVV